MSFLEAVRLAFGMIRAQKLKSFFSLLGAFVGVMFLIGVVSIVKGMDHWVRNDFAGKLFGVNTFSVLQRPRVQMSEMSVEERRELRRRPRLREQDYDAIRELMDGRALVANQSIDLVHVYHGGRRSRNVRVMGVSENYFTIRNVNIARGRAFTSHEVALGLNVAVVGQDLVDRFFSGVDPIGQEVRAGDFVFRIIGVAERQGRVFGESQDKFLIAPYTSPVKRLVNPHKIVDIIIVKTPDLPSMYQAMADVEALMRSRRHLRPGQPNNFHIETADDVLSTWAQISRVMYMALPMLVGISLVVGGIVIMNIMLMAVAERTREIGIRKALGARRRDIMRQFLVEAATLSTTGAGLGIVAGLGLARLVDALTPLPAGVSVPWIFVGVLLGIGVGVVFGVLPARKAAQLDPIAALRFE
ncbi:MAG TPA: ABC transporter permease [Gemmatimonadales bacterium]|nr:ABC transporter permease [Gemmatimonadales bacterium]